MGSLRASPQRHPLQEIAGLINGLLTIGIHWFPFRPAIRASYFLERVAWEGVPLGSHDNRNIKPHHWGALDEQ